MSANAKRWSNPTLESLDTEKGIYKGEYNINKNHVCNKPEGAFLTRLKAYITA